MNDLDILIETFLNSKESGLQLDFHREDEKVLIQMFKQKDMINWNLDFELKNLKGFCFCLFFSSQSKENKINLKRLNELYDFKHFINSKSLGVNAYFKLNNNENSVAYIREYTTKIITDVYQYEGLVKYRLNAY